MKLSIITINYNNAEGLRKTLASVASQTYADIEHIIVDGGSTDGSVEIIREYADKQAKGERLEAKGPENSSADPNASTPYTLHPTPTESSTPYTLHPTPTESSTPYTLHHTPPTHIVRWISEPDTGIYNAMNKGLEIALGKRVVNDDHTSSPLASRLSPLASDYIQILNSGDILAAPDVTERMFQAMGNGQWAIDNENNRQSPIADTEYIQILNSGDILAAPDVTERMMAALAAQCAEIKGNEEVKGYRLEVKGNENGEADTLASRLSPLASKLTSDSAPASSLSPFASRLENCPAIFYGNMTKVNAAGQVVGKSGYTEYSLRQFYQSTLNHDCAYIRKDLFEEYGLYDEDLKIVSDWKWYLQAIGLGRVKPEYVDIDVTIFDDGGISETQLDRRAAERRQVLEELLPPAVLWDYDTHAFEMEQMKRLRRWKLYPVVYFMERVLFKLEKWGVLRRGRTMYDV